MLEEEIEGVKLCFLPQKALWFPEWKYLVLSDIHLGKAEYFQQNSIAVPSQVHEKDLLILGQLIQTYAPDKVLILGDLFHHGSILGRELFLTFCQSFSTISIVWVLGNHDRSSPLLAENVVVLNEWRHGGFLFSHEALPYAEGLNIHGHEHPSVIVGTMKQKLRLPCFVKTEKRLVLPAFGNFTGTYTPQIKIATNYYVIAGESIRKIEGKQLLKKSRKY